MVMTSKSGALITKAKARELIDKYCNGHPSGTMKSVYYGRENIEEILKQPGCIGIRIYKALDDAGKSTLVLMGICEDQTELNKDNFIAEYGIQDYIA